jgi:hypothetical protein
MSPAEPVPHPGSGAALPEGLAPIAGGSPEADASAGVAGDSEPPAARTVYPEVVAVAVVFAAACIVFGIIPSPLFHLASHAGAALTGVF